MSTVLWSIAMPLLVMLGAIALERMQSALLDDGPTRRPGNGTDTSRSAGAGRRRTAVGAVLAAPDMIGSEPAAGPA